MNIGKKQVDYIILKIANQERFLDLATYSSELSFETAFITYTLVTEVVRAV